MKKWMVTWFDGYSMKANIVEGHDVLNMVHNLANSGVYNQQTIVKIEQLPNNG